MLMKSANGTMIAMLFGLDWGDEPDASTDSVVGQKDQTLRGRELLAFVDSGAVDKVPPKTPCNEYPLEKTTRSRSGIGVKDANGFHIKHYGQRRLRFKTSAGSNMNNTTWEVSDVRKPFDLRQSSV